MYRKMPRFVDPTNPAGGEVSLLDLEDATVGEAFGCLRVLPRVFLARLFSKARRTSDGAAPSDSMLSVVRAQPWSFDFAFWPAWSVGSHFPEDFAWTRDRELGTWTPVRSCEPDVVIATKPDALKSQPSGILVVVEAKWLGSSLGSDITQLPREFAGLMRSAREMRDAGGMVDFMLLCVSRHRRPPLVCEPVLSEDGKAIASSSSTKVSPHRQVSAYLELVGRHFRPDLKELLDGWAAEAATRIWHVSWQDVGSAFLEGLQALRTGNHQESGASEFFGTEGSIRLAEEVAYSLLVRRDLAGFSGFEAIDGFEINLAPTDRPWLFFESRPAAGRKR
jgi:hypothetical protein